MKPLFIVAIATVFVASSCQKHYSYPPTEPTETRRIQFWLYTKEDFTKDNHNITFVPFVQNGNSSILWDSTFATIKVNQIPDSLHKIVVDVSVRANPNSVLKVGFRYKIENVGESWLIDSSSAGSTFKLVDYSFK